MTVSAAFACALPAEDEAEAGLAGCALYALEAAELAVARVEEGDFRDARAWRVVSICAGLQHVRDLEERIRIVADEAWIEPAILRGWIENRIVFADSGGGLARQVREAGERRRRLFEFLEAGEREFGIVPIATPAAA